MRRVHVIISGDVHNVGFRSWTKHRAQQLGLKGWVRNNKDGTVEAVFEGEDHKIEEVLEDCKRGPPGSYVEKVEILEEKLRKEFEEFSIAY